MHVSRRGFLQGSLAASAWAKKAPPERPNFVIFMPDDLPAWVLGCYGNKEVRTPNIDRLAQTGARFSRHFACSPAPAPGRATLLTGRTPMQLGDAPESTAASASFERLLAAAGYSTQSSDAAAAADFIDRAPAGKPFVLTVGDPRLRPRYDVPQKYRDLYAQTKFDTQNLDRAAAPNARAGKEMLADIIGNFRRVAAAITAFDEAVGTVVSSLGRRHLLDNTAIIVISSCGALLGRHGLWDAGPASEPVNMYDEAVGTPLIWSWIGHVPAQAVRPEVVSSYDFIPTLCDLLAITPPEANLCGRSYLLPLTGKPLPKKQPWHTTVFASLANTSMARSERYKLVERDGGKGPGELYDMVNDATERANQYTNPQFLSVRNEFAHGLAAWKQRYSK